MKLRFFASVASFLLAQPAVAQEGPPLEVWIAAALKNNPSRDVSRANVLGAGAEQLRSGSLLLPTLRAQGSYVRNQYSTVVELPGGPGTDPMEIVVSPKNSLEAIISARVPLIDPPGFVRWRAARQSTEAAQQDDRANANDLALEVARHYYTAAAAEQLLRAVIRARGVSVENARIVKARLKEGAATQLASDRAAVEVARSDLLVIDARRAWEVSRRALSSATQLPEPAALSAPSPLLDPAPPEEELLRQAETGRSEIAAALHRIEQSKLARTAAWAAYAPSLHATGAQRFSNAPGFTGQANFWTAGLTAEWALLDFGTRCSDLKREGAALMRSQAQLEQVRIRVRDEVHTAWLDVEAARAKLVTARRGDEVAGRAASEMRARVLAGTATQLDLIQSDRDDLQAEVDLVRAEGELSISWLALRRAAGESLVKGEL